MDEIYSKLWRAMNITHLARHEASRRLIRLNTLCFIATTLASLGLIFIPLLDIAHYNKTFSTTGLSIFQIFLAVCTLVYSTTIAAGNLNVRAQDFLNSAIAVKKVLDQMDLEKQADGISRNLIEKYRGEYALALEHSENHENIDYINAKDRITNAKDKILDKELKSIIPRCLEYIFSKKMVEIILHIGITYLPFITLLLAEACFILDMVGITNILTVFHDEVLPKCKC